jgi:hypothetical protein
LVVAEALAGVGDGTGPGALVMAEALAGAGAVAGPVVREVEMAGFLMAGLRGTMFGLNNSRRSASRGNSLVSSMAAKGQGLCFKSPPISLESTARRLLQNWRAAGDGFILNEAVQLGDYSHAFIIPFRLYHLRILPGAITNKH